jgi:hypothetical protein
MKKGVVVAIAVWMAGFASAAVVIHQIRRPLGLANTVNTVTTAACEPAGPVEQADLAEPVPPVMDLPADTIVGSRFSGVAEKQGADDLVIGPGVVTHPSPTDSPAGAH